MCGIRFGKSWVWPFLQAPRKRTGTVSCGFRSLPQTCRYLPFLSSRPSLRTSARHAGFWHTNHCGDSSTCTPTKRLASSPATGGSKNG